MTSKPFRTTRTIANLKQGRNDWYQIKNAVDGLPTQVVIYDEIGYFGVTAQDFLNDLAGVKGPIELHLNTPGGEVFDGIAIYGALAQRADVTIIVDSLAASIGSVIAMAASPGQLKMSVGSQLMIHDGFGMAIGNAQDVREFADLLDQQSDNIASIYAARTGQPAAFWREQMRAETWYAADRAVEAGLADEVLAQPGRPVKNDWDLSLFRNAAAPDDHGWIVRDGKWVFDPDNDGDDDSTAAGDSDHDYWSADGKQLKPIPPKPTRPANSLAGVRNADKYSADDRKQMASKGHAMPDGSYPIADAEDLDNAIHAVGRGGADHDSIRKHIITRAAALGLSSKIPDNWNSDGSLQALSDFDIWAELAVPDLFRLDLPGRE